MDTKLSRSHIREAAFLLIFEKLFRDDSCEDIIESAQEADVYDFNDEVQRIFLAVSEKTEELDGIIAEFSEKRKVNRIGKVSLAVLRLAIYECLYEENVPANVAISQAVIIMGKYAFENDTQFVNGILGAFARSGKIPEEKLGDKQ
ncbi:MAG: transcription antitermination factor NusB [Oscillospiraceae bacterium]|nr:transcription antitermination factor NusB [Oscillospiraceae bacterium]